MHGKKFEKSSTLSVFFKPETENNEAEGNDTESSYDIDSKNRRTKPNESRYKKNHLINKDVLKYGYIVGIDKQFRVWDLTEWLIENNALIKESAKEDKHLQAATKIKNRLKPVSRLLENLEKLGIVYSKEVKAKKGSTKTKEYKFAYSGYLIALLFEKDETRNDSLNDEIYNFLYSSYEKLATSYAKFARSFLTKCKEIGYLDKYIKHHIKYLKNNAHLFFNTSQFLQNVNYSLPFFKEINWSLFLETLEELDENTYQLYLYDIKLHVEDTQLRKVKVYANFEEIRFNLKEEYDEVALEGFCPNCRHYRSARADLLIYLKYQINSEVLQKPCTNCNIGKIEFDLNSSVFNP